MFFPKASHRPEGFLPKAEKFFDKDDGVMLVVILRATGEQGVVDDGGYQ